MLLFRMGPRYLFIRTENVDEVTKFLEEKLKGEITDLRNGFEKASENSTLCFITGINLEKTYVEDAKKIVVINDVSTVILSSFINNHVCGLIHKIDMGPASLIMRIAAGNENKLIDKIKEIYDGKDVELIEGIGLGEKDDTMIAFTNKVINGPVALDDFLDRKILISRPVREVQTRLRTDGLRLITQSLNDSQWYELRINIYDSMGKYREHYDRLMYIFSRLEIGMILGESWTKDYAVMLYSVMTYQVRLFTFFQPNEVKKIMMALEFTADGKRLVDFDLYYKNKKIYWFYVNDNKKRKSKPEAAKFYRQELYEKLKPEDIETLEAMERSIMQKS